MTSGDNYGYDREQYRRFRAEGWRFLLCFSVLYCAFYCARVNLPNAGALLIEQLGITKAHLGVLSSTLFWTYGIGQLINGRISDQLGPEKFIVAGVVASVSINFLMAAQKSFAVMTVLWGFNGFAQSMVWAPGISIIARWWPRRKRGFATGFAYAFTGFGQAVAILVVSSTIYLFPDLGWRAVFVFPPAIPLVALGLYLAVAHTSPRRIGLPDFEEETASARTHESEMRVLAQGKDLLRPYRYVLNDPHFFHWIVIIFLVGIIRYGLTTWVPLYFVERYTVDIQSGLLNSLALPMGMGVGTLVVPWLTDRFCLDNRLRAVVFAALILPVLLTAMMFLDPTLFGQLALIELLLFLSGFCIYAISGVSNAYAADVGGRVFAGTASGILSFSAYMGAAVQSLAYGFLLDTLGWNFIFLSVAALCLIVASVSIWDLWRSRARSKNT